MLDFGFSEIVLTSAIALIVLGPEKLPKVARQVGNWMGRARAMARQLTEQLERAVNAEELMKQTKAHSATANTTAANAGVSSAPVPFDTSYTPTAYTPPAIAPDAPPAEARPSPPTAYSPQTSSPPHGADWHPSPLENKSSDG
jgi:sec-independent protein translocase protein TatB